jgi:hypothetical protein
VTKEQAFKIHYIIYQLCQESANQNPINELLVKIRKGMTKTKKVKTLKELNGKLLPYLETVTEYKTTEYKRWSSEAWEAWDKARKKHISKEDPLNVIMSELILNLYSALDGSGYQSMFYKDNAIQKVLNSFASFRGGTPSKDIRQDSKNAWLLTDEFLENIEVRKQSSEALGRLKKIVKGNLVTEGKKINKRYL